MVLRVFPSLFAIRRGRRLTNAGEAASTTTSPVAHQHG
jgi:hypothetical protein